MVTQQEIKENHELLAVIKTVKEDPTGTLISRRIAPRDAHGNVLRPYAYPTALIESLVGILLTRHVDLKTDQDFISAFNHEYDRRRADLTDPQHAVPHIISQDIDRVGELFDQELALRQANRASASGSSAAATSASAQANTGPSGSTAGDHGREDTGASSTATSPTTYAGAPSVSDTSSTVDTAPSTSPADISTPAETSGSDEAEDVSQDVDDEQLRAELESWYATPLSPELQPLAEKMDEMIEIEVDCLYTLWPIDRLPPDRDGHFDSSSDPVFGMMVIYPCMLMESHAMMLEFQDLYTVEAMHDSIVEAIRLRNSTANSNNQDAHYFDCNDIRNARALLAGSSDIWLG